MRVRLAAAVTAFAVALFGAGGSPASGAAEGTDSFTVTSGPLTATVSFEPFAIIFTDRDGTRLSTSMPVPDNPGAGPHGPLGFAVGNTVEAHQLGYHLDDETTVRWFHARRVTAVEDGTLVVATDDPLGRTLRVRVVPRGGGVLEVEATLDDTRAVVLTGAAFARSDGERFLGFGERSDGADQTGRVVTTWAEEGPFSGGSFRPATDPVFGERWQGPPPFPGTNFPMPWFVSSTGYGFLLDSTWLNEFDLGAQDGADTWSVATREPALRYRVYAGPDPADVLRRFTADTGRQPEPAPWFFGPWYQPGVEPAYWREHDVPVSVVQSYTHYLPCGAHVGRRDEQRERVAEAHAAGYRITTYVNSFVCVNHPTGAFEEGDANGYFLKGRRSGRTYPVPYVAYVEPEHPYHGIVDFTADGATAYWHRLVDDALDDGYDGWMEDFGEYVPVDAVAADGRSGLAMHNDYCSLYHEASHDLTWPRRGRDFAQFVRCGYTGTAPYARLVWGADPSEDWSPADGLAAAVSQGVSMGLSGIGYWGSDIGGFHAIQHLERTQPELQIRWLEFGAFSGVMRTQGDGYPRPGPNTYLNDRAQVWSPDVQPVWRKFTKLRTQLFPYIWDAALQYRRDGTPMMRHLALAHPDDPEVFDPAAEYEFLFGDDLLVAPVVTPGARERRLYLPAGRWVNFWEAVSYDEDSGAFTSAGTAPVVDGGRYVTVAAPLDEIPLFVRARTCLPLLPAEVDTLATVGSAPGLVHADDVGGARTVLGFAASCAGAAPHADSRGNSPGSSAGERRGRGGPSSLPATGGTAVAAGLSLLGLAALIRRRP